MTPAWRANSVRSAPPSSGRHPVRTRLDTLWAQSGHSHSYLELGRERLSVQVMKGKAPLPRGREQFTPDRRLEPGWLCSSVVSNQLPPPATPAEVAEYLRTTTAALAQDRYKG